MSAREVSERVKLWLIRIAAFLGPFGIAGLYILILYVSLDRPAFVALLTGMGVYFFPPLGKETVIPVWVNTMYYVYDMGPMESIGLVAGSVAFLDIIVGVFLLWNFYIIEKIPLLGKWVKRFEAGGKRKLQEKPWIQGLAFTGVVLFVMFPFQGSGGVGATILGKIIGMNKYKVLAAIIIGAIAGCFLIAYISFYIGREIVDFMRSGAEVALILFAMVLSNYLIWRFMIKGRGIKWNHPGAE